MVGGQIQMEFLLGRRQRGVGGEQAAETADLGLREDENGDHDARRQEHERLDDVGPDDGLQAAQDRIDAGDDREYENPRGVAYFEVRAAQQVAQGARADVETQGHAHDHDGDDGERRIEKAAARVVALRQVFRQGIEPHLAVERQEHEGQNQQPGDRAVFEVRLREADRIADAEHADEMLRADVGAENRAGHAPPGDALAGQEKILRALFLAARPQPDRHDHDQARQKNRKIEGAERNGHGSQGSALPGRRSGTASDRMRRADKSPTALMRSGEHEPGIR